MNRLVYSNKKQRRFKIVLTSFAALLAVAITFYAKEGRSGRSIANNASAPKTAIAQALGKRLVTVPQVQDDGYTIQYSIDQRLQQSIEQTLKHGKVPYAAFVAIDPKTGQVLSMVSHGMRGENLAVRATFPAASIFKVVTAAAAIESGKLQHNSLIPVRGSYHTLYRQNVLKGGGIDPDNRPRYARLISFEDALAKSVNSVFGKVGLFGVGPDGLRKVATKFQFGKEIPFEMPVEESQATVPNDEFGVAESASGFTRGNTLSPLHGALIAASVANGGVMMEPSVVSHLVSKDGKTEYTFEPKQLATVMEKQTAEELATMMHRTIVNGTSRRAFRNADRSLALSDVYIGGKTGTLNGWSPAGRYDWFVGFAERGNSKIAVAAMCIHEVRHGIKASQVARVAFETYFGATVAQNPAPISVVPQHHHSRRHRKLRRNTV